MAVFRRRLLFWLLKAYIKRWGKVIILSFILGLIAFFGLMTASTYVARLIPVEKKVRIGVIGAYSIDNLPNFVTSDISHGLTKVLPDGTIQPDVARKWEIKDNGKTYVFHLNTNLKFSDGSNVSSSDLGYKFANVSIDTSDDNLITFRLKDAYSPFLVTVARPIFKEGFIGIGEYKLSDIKLNGNFVESLTITSNKNKFFARTYVFIPVKKR